MDTNCSKENIYVKYKEKSEGSVAKNWNSLHNHHPPLEISETIRMRPWATSSNFEDKGFEQEDD